MSFMDATMSFRRDDDDNVVYYNPAAQIYVGLWCLLAGASVFLALRLWCKITRRHGLWYDDYVLIAAYVSRMSRRSIFAWQPPL